MIDTESLSERLKKYLDSPEGRKSTTEYISKLKAKEAILDERIQLFREKIKDETSFNLIMDRVMSKQNRYDAKHYQTYQDKPLNLTSFIFEFASRYGSVIDPIDEFTENFPSSVYEYYNYQIGITHGQGSVLSIYKNKECIYRS